MDDVLTIANRSFRSRLFVGTGKYRSKQLMARCHTVSGTEMVTLAVRRVNLTDRSKESELDFIDHSLIHILPNTAACYTAEDAIRTARLGREVGLSNWVKLEVIGDRETLYPDVTELIDATRRLTDEGFVVLPYCTDDPVVCQRLAGVGAAAVMPMGSLIGSGMGVANPANLELICRRSEVPVIVDAGIGTASDAVIAMELGAAAVLLNTAVARADDPVRMAAAMRHAVEAGRHAYLAGRIPRRGRAEPSSPQLGLVGS